MCSTKDTTNRKPLKLDASVCPIKISNRITYIYFSCQISRVVLKAFAILIMHHWNAKRLGNGGWSQVCCRQARLVS